ncbi:MAG: hypothetical protein A2987_05760 [Omnitrophica bacterium RIFCSPLOWO2_01_FULL_45_10]|nr:MAG: hypothetical protein A2987_05760 [Omnitrophica bacterium RIFCSPLOWO2_01_FULL_45_10]
MKRIYLSAANKKLGGVCGGIGEYFEVDPTLIRVIFIIATLFSLGLGILAYFLIWLIMPRRPKGGA